MTQNDFLNGVPEKDVADVEYTKREIEAWGGWWKLRYTATREHGGGTFTQYRQTENDARLACQKLLTKIAKKAWVVGQVPEEK